ncbi:MAG: DUF4351 domain-containing protein [Proteobacteria bacterium]|nr:DUF4351 domain-containing protein [Pseudomonadota bacterium]
MIKYVLRGSSGEDVKILLEKIQTGLSSELRGEAMTFAEQLKQMGRQEGITQGIVQGVHQGQTALFTRLLRRRFHEIPEFYLNSIEKADAEILLLWSEKILDAKTLEEVFQ